MVNENFNSRPIRPYYNGYPGSGADTNPFAGISTMPYTSMRLQLPLDALQAAGNEQQRRWELGNEQLGIYETAAQNALINTPEADKEEVRAMLAEQDKLLQGYRDRKDYHRMYRDINLNATKFANTMAPYIQKNQMINAEIKAMQDSGKYSAETIEAIRKNAYSGKVVRDPETGRVIDLGIKSKSWAPDVNTRALIDDMSQNVRFAESVKTAFGLKSIDGVPAMIKETIQTGGKKAEQLIEMYKSGLAADVGFNAMVDRDVDLAVAELEANGVPVNPVEIRKQIFDKHASDAINYGVQKNENYYKNVTQSVDVLSPSQLGGDSRYNSNGIINVGVTEGFQLTTKDHKALLSEVEASEKVLATYPPGHPEYIKAQANKQRAEETLNTVYSAVNKGENLNKMNQLYAEFIREGGSLSRPEFDKLVMTGNADDTPGIFRGLTRRFGTRWVAPTKEEKAANVIAKAVATYDKAAKEYASDNHFAADGMVLTGSTGSKDWDTFVGRSNEQFTQDFHNSSAAYNIGGKGVQADDYLAKNYKEREMSNDQITMTGAVIDGKHQLQLKIFDENKQHIGTEFIEPEDQASYNGALVRASEEMMQNANPAVRQQGRLLMDNVLFMPSIQASEFRNYSSGEIPGINSNNEKIKYKREGTSGQYKLYVGDKPFIDRRTGAQGEFYNAQELASLLSSNLN